MDKIEPPLKLEAGGMLVCSSYRHSKTLNDVVLGTLQSIKLLKDRASMTSCVPECLIPDGIKCLSWKGTVHSRPVLTMNAWWTDGPSICSPINKGMQVEANSDKDEVRRMNRNISKKGNEYWIIERAKVTKWINEKWMIIMR